jgi:hypothetical protein
MRTYELRMSRNEIIIWFYGNYWLFNSLLPKMMSSSPTSSSKVVLKRKKSSLCEIKVTLLGDRNVGKSGMSYVRRNDY